MYMYSYFQIFREKSIKVLVYALNLFIVFYVCTVNMIVNFNEINRDCNRNISITL